MQGARDAMPGSALSVKRSTPDLARHKHRVEGDRVRNGLVLDLIEQTRAVVEVPAGTLDGERGFASDGAGRSMRTDAHRKRDGPRLPPDALSAGVLLQN